MGMVDEEGRLSQEGNECILMGCVTFLLMSWNLLLGRGFIYKIARPLGTFSDTGI